MGDSKIDSGHNALLDRTRIPYRNRGGRDKDIFNRSGY